MEPEPNLDVDELKLDPTPVVDIDSSGISVDLEIASVYKPRPIRRRAPSTQVFPGPGQGKRIRSRRARSRQALVSQLTAPALLAQVCLISKYDAEREVTVLVIQTLRASLDPSYK